ncbi:MAG: type II toxin-antitoxin system RelE/ParE family toxin [Hydrogenovibrio sp.]
MITLNWTNKAASDLERLYEFLKPQNPSAAAKVVQNLSAAPKTLMTHPRLGEKLDTFEPREVRRLFVGAYEMRYEIQHDTLYILRIWHTKESR